MDVKSLFASKTFWLNILVLPAAQLLLRYGVTLDPDTVNALSIVAVAAANIGMRLFTQQPVTVLPAPKIACWFLVLPIAGPLLLGACANSQVTLADLCPLYKASYPGLQASTDPTTQNLLAFGSSLCNPVTGEPLPTAPSDPDTSIWYQGILAALKIGVPLAIGAL